MRCNSCSEGSPAATITTVNLAAFGVLSALAALTTVVVLSTLGYAYLYKAMGLVTGVSSSGLKTCLTVAKWSAVGCGGALFLGITPKVAQKMIGSCCTRSVSNFRPIERDYTLSRQQSEVDPGGGFGMPTTTRYH